MTDTNHEDGPAVRRHSIRRNRSGARFSNRGADPMGSPRPYEEDEVDDAIDPMQVSTNVSSRAVATRDDGPDSPAQRVFDVGHTASPSYSKEFRLELVGRLLMRKIPLDRIARQLNVSVSTVEKDRAAWKKMLAERARSFDVNEYLGQQMAFYDEVSGQAMQVASMSSGENAAPIAMRLAAMRTAMAGQNDKTRTLHSAGVFEAARFRRASDGSAMSDVQTLMQQTMQALEDLMTADAPPPARPRPPAPSRARVPSTGGFAEMSMAESNDNDQEVLEL